MSQKAYLVLENGKIFCGDRFGAPGDIKGEVVFTTGMTGYLETLTDPSYHGQIVVQTFPLIGNYGVIPADFESKRPALLAYIVRHWCEHPSNFRSQGNLDATLKQYGVIGLTGIDTRALTKIIREQGVMNGLICSALPEDMAALTQDLKKMRIGSDVKEVTCKTPYTMGDPSAKYHVLLWDFGTKGGIPRALIKENCHVSILPAETTAEQILSYKPDGLVLSNGPGDPVDNPEIIAEIAKLTQAKIPTLGICLGHQLMALARGAKRAKLKYGHRGANQPVKDIDTGRVYITSQNHGYTVVNEPFPSCGRVRMINTNDGTCEGIDYLDTPAFSIQFHPEACAGPLDTAMLFKRFIQLMEEHTDAVE